MAFFLETLMGGLMAGMLYSLVALGFVLIFKASGVFNFAQGAMAMFAAYLGMTLSSHGLNFWACFAIAIAAGFVLGGLTERVLVRPLYRRPEINSIVVMVGFLGVLESAAAATRAPSRMRTPWWSS